MTAILAEAERKHYLKLLRDAQPLIGGIEALPYWVDDAIEGLIEILSARAPQKPSTGYARIISTAAEQVRGEGLGDAARRLVDGVMLKHFLQSVVQTPCGPAVEVRIWELREALISAVATVLLSPPQPEETADRQQEAEVK